MLQALDSVTMKEVYIGSIVYVIIGQPSSGPTWATNENMYI